MDPELREHPAQVPLGRARAGEKLCADLGVRAALGGEFWGLLGLIVFGIVAIFVSIPNSNLISPSPDSGSSARSRSSTSTGCAARMPTVPS
jgi:uncharacterized membrane protein